MEQGKALTPAPPSNALEQIKRNIEAYERVYGLCLDAADRIAEKRFGALLLTKEDRFVIAKTLFNRFYDDQNEAVRGDRAQKPVVEAVQGIIRQLLERRGGMTV